MMYEMQWIWKEGFESLNYSLEIYVISKIHTLQIHKIFKLFGNVCIILVSLESWSIWP